MEWLIKYLLVLLMIQILSIGAQISNICYSPTTTCFAPNTTQLLLFDKGAYTTCSRVPPLLKLNCRGDSSLCARYSNQINQVKCSNQGLNDKGEVIWLCEAKLPLGISFSKTVVSCEGCVTSIDKLKIIGSCAVFYELAKKSTGSNSSSGSNNSSDSSSVKYVFALILLFGIVISCVICYQSCCQDEKCFVPHNHCSHARAYRNIDIHDIEAVPLTSTSTSIPSAPPARTHYIQPSQQFNFTQPIRSPKEACFAGPIQQTHSYQSNQSNPSEILGGYIAGKNIQEGNYGAAILASGLSSNSNSSNYQTGMLMGMMSESSHKHHHKHHNKHHNNSNSYDTSYQNSDNFSTHNEAYYADTETR